MGREKAFLDLEGRPLIAHVAERLGSVADELIIAADDQARFQPFAGRVVPDIFPCLGTLGGIHAGLSAARYDLALVVGCDMPFIDPDVLIWFADAAAAHDVVVLRRPEGIEPLHAAYRRSCLPAIEAAIRSGQRRAVSFHAQVRVRYVDPVELLEIDPDLSSFRNLNTPAEWSDTIGRR